MKTSVRFLAVLFALIMAMFTVASAADYSDVDASNANYDAIELLTTLGVLHGYDDGTFRPDDKVQRDEMAKMVYIMATAFDNAGEGVKIFPDVAQKHWASGFIAWASTKEIVGGYEDGTFRPDDNITYDEALKMTAAMLGYTDFDPELWPSDVRIVALKQLGLGENIPETVAGDTVITRAQAAQIIYNAFYKTMGTTKTVTYYETGYVEEDGVTAAGRETKVQVPMTLAEDVWNCKVYNYKIVATENYAVNDVTNKLTGNTKTGEENEIKVVNLLPNGKVETRLISDMGTPDDTSDDVYAAVVETLDIEELGLTEYVGNTDSIIGFTLSKITKDGEDFALSGVKGVKYEGVTLSTVGAKAADYEGLNEGSAWESSKTYWFKDRLNVNGTVYTDDNFWNLRAVYVETTATETTFNVMSMPIAFSDKFSNASNHWWETPFGTVIPETTPPYKNNEVHFNSYLLGYKKRVWGIDSEGDGVIDYLFLKFTQPFKVTNVVDFVNNGKKGQTITIADLYNSTNTWSFDKEDILFAGELKKDDIFVGANFGKKLYVSSVTQPQTSYITAITGSSVKMNGIGSLTIGGSYVGKLGLADTIFPTRNNKAYWLNKNADGTMNELTVWVHGSAMIWSTAAVEDAKTSYDKAILLYVDKKSEKQIDKATNKFVYFYPAYLLINGKEEAVNLDPENAIDGRSGDYVSADGSEFRATINTDGTLANVYKVVTYEKDKFGYYSLKTVNSDLEDEEDNLLEKVIPLADNPKLQYNANTKLYTIVTDTETLFNVDVSEDTYLYYNYTKPSTGSYQYIGFYTSDHIKGEIDDVTFASDVYLTYNDEDDFYTLQSAMLAGEIDNVEIEEGYVDVNKDGRVIYMATADSSYVAHNDDVYYEHYLMNPATGETITVIQEKKSFAEGALYLEAGKFYAWDALAEDYKRVTAEGVSTAVATVDKYTIASVNTGRDIIYTTAGDYASGIKLTDIPVFAFDDELNRYELNVSDIEQFNDIIAEVVPAETMDIIFVSYEDENGDMQIAYAIADYAERVDGLNDTVVPTPHTDVVDLFAGI